MTRKRASSSRKAKRELQKPRFYLSINRCPLHPTFMSISIDEPTSSGYRLTGSKCCGQWKKMASWAVEVSTLVAEIKAFEKQVLGLKGKAK